MFYMQTVSDGEITYQTPEQVAPSIKVHVEILRRVYVSEFGFPECAPPSSTNDVPKKWSNYEVLLKNSWGLMLSSIMARGTLLSNHLPGSNLSNIKG